VDPAGVPELTAEDEAKVEPLLPSWSARAPTRC
jgi:hypothetical protein